MPTLNELIARRTDLGTFIVHLTKDTVTNNAKQNLLDILNQKKLRATSPYGSAVHQLNSNGNATQTDKDSQKVVCFTETPLEYIHLLTKEIDDVQRSFKFQAYGLAITKRLARKKGVNPIWYIDMTPGHNWLTVPLNNLINAAINNGTFATSDIAKIAPFTEQMGSQSGNFKKEFWWEREWRHLGDFDLPVRIILIAPEVEHAEFLLTCNAQGIKASCVDVNWGIEAIIARLAGFDASDVGPI